MVDVRIGRQREYARLVFELTGRVDYDMFKLDDPERVVIDLDRSVLRVDFSGLDLRGSPISTIRTGRQENDVLRVVLDLSFEVEASSFFLKAMEGFRDRLVIDMHYLEVDQQISAARIQPVQEDERRDIRVAIAAGHGGIDPGAISRNGLVREKDVTLAVSRIIRDRLAATPGYTPVMIREGDETVHVKDRPGLVRESRADIYLAIHADSYPGYTAEGVTIYALSGDTADMENARRIADKESRTDLLSNEGDIRLTDVDDDIALTLLDLAMTHNIQQSMKAGDSILASIDAVARLRRDKVQAGDLWELRSPDIPSLLIETGYLSNEKEAVRLATPSYQRHIANAIVRGVMNYFNESPPPGTLVAWQKAEGVVPGTYMVESGDSLSVIAETFGAPLAELKSLNNIQSNTIRIGQSLIIPGSGLTAVVTEHTIVPGDTLSELAERYKTSIADLRQANNLTNDDRIRAGQTLQIPAF